MTIHVFHSHGVMPLLLFFVWHRQGLVGSKEALRFLPLLASALACLPFLLCYYIFVVGRCTRPGGFVPSVFWSVSYGRARPQYKRLITAF